MSIDNSVTPIAALLSGLLQQTLGPKVESKTFFFPPVNKAAQLVLMVTCLPYSLAWVLAALAGSYTNVSLLYVSRYQSSKVSS